MTTMIDKIETLMLKKRISKADLSRGAKIPYTTVDGMWKKGTDNIKRTTLVKLARYFECSIDYIADDNIEANSTSRSSYAVETLNETLLQTMSATEQNHIKKYRALDERGKQTVDMVLDSQYELIVAKKEITASDKAIEQELESYRQELLAEQKGKTLSVSTNIKGA